MFITLFLTKMNREVQCMKQFCWTSWLFDLIMAYKSIALAQTPAVADHIKDFYIFPLRMFWVSQDFSRASTKVMKAAGADNFLHYILKGYSRLLIYPPQSWRNSCLLLSCTGIIIQFSHVLPFLFKVIFKNRLI